MQPDAEHQENDANLGKLIGDILVGDEARRERPDDDARHQIADQRRQLEAVRNDAEAEGEHEADREGGNEGRHMQHEMAFGTGLVTRGDKERHLRVRPRRLAYTLTMNGAADNPLAHP